MVGKTITSQYRKAFAELEILLENLDSDQKKMIPQELIENFSREKDPEYKFIYNKSKDLLKQDILPQTKALLLELYEQYIAEDEDKKMWERYDMYCFRLIEERKREKYDPDEIFRSTLSDDISDQGFSIGGNDDVVFVNYDSNTVAENEDKKSVDDKLLHPENYSEEEKLGIAEELKMEEERKKAKEEAANPNIIQNGELTTVETTTVTQDLMVKVQNIFTMIMEKIKEIINKILKKDGHQDNSNLGNNE